MKKLVLLIALFAILTSGANAVVVGLHTASTATLGSGSGYYVSGSHIYIWENWTSHGNLFLAMGRLQQGVNYTVHKFITNNTGVDWDHFSNELLDRRVDYNDLNPQPSWIPDGFSTSTDRDGLSFAQGYPIPRTSRRFASLYTNELAGRDYIDFYNGLVSGNGGTDTLTFGLRDYDTYSNEPFLLAQRPNEFVGPSSTPPSVPEPATLALLGFGLAGLALRKRFRK